MRTFVTKWEDGQYYIGQKPVTKEILTHLLDTVKVAEKGQWFERLDKEGHNIIQDTSLVKFATSGITTDPYSYTTGSDIDEDAQEFNDRSTVFDQEDATYMDKGHDWLWGEPNPHDFPSTMVYQRLDEKQPVANTARASKEESWYESLTKR